MNGAIFLRNSLLRIIVSVSQFKIAITVIACLVGAASMTKADDVAVFYALDADFQGLKGESSSSRQPIKVGERTVQVLGLGKHKLYAVKMGSGAVETAASTQALLARFRCDRAYSLGPVGALSDELKIGKWYRVASMMPYQKGSWTSAGFQLSKDLSKTTAIEELEATSSWPQLFRDVKSITVASGEVFIASSSYREQLQHMTNADAVDMNLFGLITVCEDHHVPLINWRIVSDKADDSASEDFRKFTQAYDGAGGKALAELIRNLPPNPNSPESYPELEKLLKK